ncbi:MAG: cation diffusion facilitator family transporter [Alicyclobacillus sp.]|nr:cation diffusion facilitator family transporter [Alicyclobacillus sp.]
MPRPAPYPSRVPQPDTEAGDHDHQAATRVVVVTLVVLLVTSGLQAVIAIWTGSAGLLADTIHNFGDALTSVPLLLAFRLSRRPPTKQFPYGLHRSEDLAGLLIVLVIAATGFAAGYQSFMHLLHGSIPTRLGTAAAGAGIGFVGNEAAAILRMRMGERLGSAALTADGRHALVDGFTSLAVLAGLAGAWLGYPIVDPVMGLAITAVIFWVVKSSGRSILWRLLDGMEPETLDMICQHTLAVPGVRSASEARARWSGHQIHVEITIYVDGDMTVKQGHEIAHAVIRQLRSAIPHVRSVQVHVDPVRHSFSADEWCRPQTPEGTIYRTGTTA